MTTPTGTIQSNQYPRPYPHYRVCYWRIAAPSHRRVRLEFLDFDLEESVARSDGTSFCPDYVTVSTNTLNPSHCANKV